MEINTVSVRNPPGFGKEDGLKKVSGGETEYIITGASGHLGNTLVRRLMQQRKEVTGLLLPGEKPPVTGMRTVYGNICEKESLRPLFLSGRKAVVIHYAGCVSISSYDGLKLWNTNVLGTRNLVELAEEYGVSKFIYVSSVHALPEPEDGRQITEIRDFDDSLVVGDYAKTKAAATRYVLREAASGFPACTVHPSGLLGPYDPGSGQMTRVLKLFLKGLLPAAVAGGYDFADVRDVADGILSCCDQGKAGESYILSGHYYSIREFLNLAAQAVHRPSVAFCLPRSLAGALAAVSDRISHSLGRSTIFTPYSIYTLGSNSNFSHQKASDCLGYHTRSREETVRDMVGWTIHSLRTV